MVQMGSILKVSDKTGVVLVQCIKVLGYFNKRTAVIGDVIVVSVKHINPSKFKKMKLFRRKKFFKGTVHRGLVIRTHIIIKDLMVYILDLMKMLLF